MEGTYVEVNDKSDTMKLKLEIKSIPPICYC